MEDSQDSIIEEYVKKHGEHRRKLFEDSARWLDNNQVPGVTIDLRKFFDDLLERAK